MTKSKKVDDAVESFKKDFSELDLSESTNLIKKIGNNFFLNKKELISFNVKVRQWLLKNNKIILD